MGSGGALTGGKYAPPLDSDDVTPTQIYEAMLTGPQAMPVFNDTTLTPENKRDIIAYLVKTREEPNPGGNGLGRIGPVSEGLAGWLIGLGLLVLAAMWITAKKPKKLKKLKNTAPNSRSPNLVPGAGFWCTVPTIVKRTSQSLGSSVPDSIISGVRTVAILLPLARALPRAVMLPFSEIASKAWAALLPAALRTSL